MIKYDLTLIDDLTIGDIDMRDYPYFCDAYVDDASYNGIMMSEEQLDELNEQIVNDSESTDWFYDKVWWTIH